MLRLLLALILVAAPTAALAAGKTEEKAVPPYVDLAPVGLPIVVKGRAVNYVFLSIRLHVAPGHDPLKLLAMEPFYRDALIRAGHRQPFVKADDHTVVDEVRLKTVLLSEARRISGPKAFAGVEIKSQTPRRRAGMLRPQAQNRRPAPKSL